MKTTMIAAIVSGLWIASQTTVTCATFQQMAPLWAARNRASNGQETNPGATLTVDQTVRGGGLHRRVTPAERSSDESSIEAAANAAATPAEFCRILTGRVKYEPDMMPSQEWKIPEMTWLDGSGDCEDYALCVKRFCEVKGVPAEIRVYTCTKTGQGHVVALGEWNGRRWMSSNGSYTEVAGDQDVRAFMVSFYGCGLDQVVERNVTAQNVAGTESLTARRAPAAKSPFVIQ